MTTELQQLSTDVAKLEGIEPKSWEVVYGKRGGMSFGTIWLHEDSARCFEIMCKHELWPRTQFSLGYDCVIVNNKYGHHIARVPLELLNNDSAATTRVAILRARLAMG